MTWLYLFLGGCTSAVALTHQLTSVEGAQIVQAIRDRIPTTCLGDRADFIAGNVRLAFHDCIGNGGCNGCFQTSLKDNRGLAEINSKLQPIITQFQGKASRADIWALAAIVSIHEAGGPAIPFFAGRNDCADEALENDEGFMPEASPKGDTWQHIREVFTDRLGFNSREIVALMGAHTLGRAVKQNSDFEGQWVPDAACDGVPNGACHGPGYFSRHYYIALQEVQWNAYSNVQLGGRVWLSVENSNTLMLDTDMALIMDPDSCDAIDSFKGFSASFKSHKVGDNCKTNDAIAAIVQEYAFDFDGTKFFPDFSAAFQKLLKLGTQALQPELQLLGARMTYHTLKDCVAANVCAMDSDCPNQFFPKCDTTASPLKCISLTCANNDDCPHAKAARCDLAENRCDACDNDDQCDGSQCAFGECATLGSTTSTTDVPVSAASTTVPHTSATTTSATTLVPSSSDAPMPTASATTSGSEMLGGGLFLVLLGVGLISEWSWV